MVVVRWVRKSTLPRQTANSQVTLAVTMTMMWFASPAWTVDQIPVRDISIQKAYRLRCLHHKLKKEITSRGHC